MAPLVNKGDTIYVPAEFLGGNNGKKLTIHWSQMLRSRNEDYWLCKYTVESGAEKIYVQASKLEEFKQKKKDGKDFTFVVDDSFQYGQDKEKTKRFLVFHDKSNKPYQHRFVENTYTELGGKAADFLESLGFKDAGTVEDVARRFAGDELHNF
ncbi:uncharacterized protein Z519_06333 [Cladophialophora bantiana CBS 173.52]|uniref:Uncharacterized protein n=1 Tax=Cladophialophora bantiana (strain ATCC 10958 / CBS 173.52 / CDC B-1940 / NIH 8579) TaxID=1442370 RepID=A0A0D2ERK1_CLAB1|nr:uncharacterized protein Z519_06333 [Cladophialophora bantiana CBS 173.52]KIW92486.1 hypothetical protein Z519_06333 [Cladophialophora bantiana CBS 173.52]